MKNRTISEMFFEEQDQVFVQVVVSQALSPIFILRYLPKKELARMFIPVRKIFNCLSNAVIVPLDC